MSGAVITGKCRVRNRNAQRFGMRLINGPSSMWLVPLALGLLDTHRPLPYTDDGVNRQGRSWQSR